MAVKDTAFIYPEFPPSLSIEQFAARIAAAQLTRPTDKRQPGYVNYYLFVENLEPAQKARLVEEWALLQQREAASTATGAAMVSELLEQPETRVAGLILAGAVLAACTRSANSGVIPSPEGSPTPEPSHTPTGTAESTATHTHTATAALTAAPPPATELLVAPFVTSTPEHASPTPFMDADGDGVPDLPNFDTNGDGRIDVGELATGVVAMAEWFGGEVRTLADGENAPLMVKTVAHLFGHNATTLRTEAAAASGAPLVDLQWVPDHLLDPNDPTVVNGLTSHDGIGILTTGGHLSEIMSKLAWQVENAGEKLHDPDREVNTSSGLLNGLTDQLGLENLWRPGLPPQATDEIGRNGDMCVVMDAGAGRAQRAPVVVEAGIEVGAEFQDRGGRWHVSPESPMEVVARLVHRDELPELQALWQANGEFVEVTQVTPEHSIAVQVYLNGEDPLDGAQLVACGKPQAGVQELPIPTISPTATPTATPAAESRPHGGGDHPPTAAPAPTAAPTEAPPPPSATFPPRPTLGPPNTPRPTDVPPPSSSETPIDTAIAGAPSTTPNPPTPTIEDTLPGTPVNTPPSPDQTWTPSLPLADRERPVDAHK